MIRNLKVLGLLAVAALAISAFGASAAQAQEGTFTLGETPETHTEGEITGKQIGNVPTTNYFKAGTQRISCTNEGVDYQGETLTGVETDLTMTASYNKCWVYEEDEPSLPVTVNMNGCDYHFDRPHTVEEEVYTGTVDLVCEESEGVEIDVYLFGNEESHSVKVCHILVTPGNNTEHVVYTPDPEKDNGKDAVIATATVEGQIPVHKSGTCGESTEFSDFHSQVTVTSPGHDVWISD